MTGIARYFIRKAHNKYKSRKERKLKAQQRRQTDFRKNFGQTHGQSAGVKMTANIDKHTLPQYGSKKSKRDLFRFGRSKVKAQPKKKTTIRGI